MSDLALFLTGVLLLVGNLGGAAVSFWNGDLLDGFICISLSILLVVALIEELRRLL